MVMSAGLIRPGARPITTSPSSRTADASINPARSAPAISPDSSRQVGRWSTRIEAARASRRGSTSNAAALPLPTIAMCVPGSTAAVGKSGEVELVVVTTTCAPRIASSALIALAPVCRAARSLAASWFRPTIRISPNSRSRVIARRCAAACGPVPKTVSTVASGRASSRSETALHAEVRTSVAARASSVAIGRPVLDSKAVREPWRRSSPSAGLLGRTLITLTVSTSKSVSTPEMRKVPAPPPRSMWARIGAMAAPRDTMPSAAAIASATRAGSSAMISSRLKFLYTCFLANRCQRLEEFHRFLATRDRELEDEVADPQFGRAAKVRHDLLAHAAERGAPGRHELRALPSLLRGRLGDVLPAGCDLEAGAHRDLHPIQLAALGGQLVGQLTESHLELFKCLPVPDPPVAEADRPPQRRTGSAADEDGEAAIRMRPRPKVKAREVVHLAVKLRLV